jgi:hypothetical protein
MKKPKEVRIIHYNYYCFDCKNDIVLDYKENKEKKHPSCPICDSTNTKCMGQEPPNYKVIGGETLVKNRRKLEKFVRDGMEKGDADRFYNESIAASKERMKSGGEQYSKVVMNPEELASMGQAKVVSDKERSEKMKVAKAVTADAAKKARFDIRNATKQNGTTTKKEKK